MIKITEVSGQQRVLNAELIEYIDAVPDTLIVLVNGHRHMVRETPDEIIRLVLEYRRQCLGGFLEKCICGRPFPAAELNS